MARRSSEARRIVDLGQKIYGDNWQSSFARMTGLSKSYVGFIAKGDRPVTQTVAVAVIRGLRAEVKRLNEQAAAMKAMSEKYEAAVLTKWLPGK